jgi:hypothetical protein
MITLGSGAVKVRGPMPGVELRLAYFQENAVRIVPEQVLLAWPVVGLRSFAGRSVERHVVGAQRLVHRVDAGDF